MEAPTTEVNNDAVQDSISPQNDSTKQSSIKIQNNNNMIVDTVELLGSVTTFPISGIDGPAVRTSARVIHKLRMDSTPLPQPEKKETQNESSTVNAPKTPSQTKTHVRVQWSNEERNFFFDALNEHGRDFEQISRFINLKMKRKTPSDKDYKGKEHIRQLYYQFFQKASKYLRFSDDVKKLAQELYTLINYGEMKRKQVMSSEKSFLKLRDLVYKGSVVIRWKGKNIKIKTPSCRALRILNGLEGSTVEDVQLPQRIDVVLRPVNMKSWGFVQTLAQNPRIRMVSLPLQRRLASLLHTMQQKWQISNNRLYEKYVLSCIQRHGVQKIGEEIVTQSQADLVQLKKDEPILFFKPPRDTPIHRPMVQLNELLSSFNICLNSYENRIGATTRGENLCTEKIAHIKDLLKHPSKRMRFDSASEKNAKVKVEEQITCKISEEIGMAVIDYKSNDSVDNDMKKIEIKEEESAEVKLKQTFNLNLDHQKDEPEDVLLTPVAPTFLPTVAPSKVDETVEKPPTVIPVITSTSTTKSKKKDSLLNGHLKSSKEQMFKPLIDDEMLRKVRKGWSLKTVGDLTIGDLYLMFGSDSRLVLEYDIVEESTVQTEDANDETNNCKLDLKLGSKLKNLMSVATLLESNDSSHGDSIFKQPTGPRMDTFSRLNPRVKAARWRPQPVRPLANQFMAGASGNHVVRDLYQTPATVENQMSKNQIEKDKEVTKILEEKIQDYSGKARANGFSESSRSSMRSLLDCFSTGDVRKTESISDGE